MSTDLTSIPFSNKVFGDGKWPRDMDELVTGWISYEARQTLKGVTEGLRSLSAAEAERVADLDISNTDDEEFFWAAQCEMDLSDEHPDLALEFVREVLRRDLPLPILGLLAAGPLEQTLANHGPAIINAVEAEARRDPKFRHLLGGVWQNAMTDDIWNRINQLCPEKW